MSVKDCGQHKDKKKELRKMIYIGVWVIIALIIVVGFIILILWLALRPTKPTFVLQDATVYTFNVSGTPPNLLSSTILLTIRSQNPNDRVSIYYDHLIVYAVYRNQQITLPTALPPAYQDNGGVNIWSPFVSGALVPISPYVGAALSQDETAGNLPMDIKLDGQVRWRVWAFITGSYRLHVDCPALFAVGSPHSNAPLGYNAVKYQLAQSCSVTV